MYSFFPDVIQTNRGYYTINRTILINGPQKSVLGGLLLYKADTGYQFLLQANIKKHGDNQHTYHLYPGRFLFPAPLLREHLLEAHKNAKVFLCENPLIAEDLNIIIQGSNTPSGTFISTSRYGGFSVMAYGDNAGLKGKKIIYIPDISKESYTRALQYEKLCRDAGALDFFILSDAVVRTQISYTQDQLYDLYDSWEYAIVKDLITLAGKGPEVLDYIVHRAKTPTAFQQWGEDVELFPSATLSGNEEGPFARSVAELLSRSPRRKDNRVYTDCFAAKGNTGVILGDRNAGKSIFAAGLATAWACGLPYLGYTAQHPQKGLIVDAEGNEASLGLHLRQFANALGGNQNILEQNLQFWNFGEQGGGQINLNEDFDRKKVEESIKANKIKFVIFDTLISSLPGFIKSGGTSWDNFFSWLRSLEQKYGTIALILHHTSAAERSAGTLSIERQCRTVLRLEGREHIRKREDDSLASALGPYLEKDGALFKATFAKCKLYPELERRPFGAYLPLQSASLGKASSWLRFDLPEIAMPDGLQKEVSVASIKERYPDLTDNEAEVLVLANGGYHFTRKDAEKHLYGRSGSSVLSILTLLIGKGLLKRVGNGRATKYHAVKTR